MNKFNIFDNVEFHAHGKTLRGKIHSIEIDENAYKTDLDDYIIYSINTTLGVWRVHESMIKKI